MIFKLLIQTTALLAAMAYARYSFRQLSLLVSKEPKLSLNKQRLILIMLAAIYLFSCVAIGAMLGKLWQPIMRDLMLSEMGNV